MRMLSFSLVGLMCCLLPGCGGADSLWVTVDLKKGGQPFVASENQSVQVTFYGMEPKDSALEKNFVRQPFSARLKGEASYEVPGPDGWGIPAGKYRISVIHKPKTGTLKAAAPTGRRAPKAPDRDQDFLRGVFSPESSPIIRTVEKSCHLIIDLDRPTE
jgi:hypothetical protein